MAQTFRLMEQNLKFELLQLFSALLLGDALGILYDLQRALRYRGDKNTALIFDIIFCLISGSAVFIYFMWDADAEAGIWQVLLIPAGFLIYCSSLSRAILPIFTGLLEFFIKFYAKSEKNIKKLLNSAKNIFQNMR